MTQDELTIDLLCEASDRLEMILERIEKDMIEDHPHITWEYETAKNSLNKINNFLTKIGAVDNMMTQEAFDILDEMYGGLIPQQDLDSGTYEWVCNFSGGKFYHEILSDEQVEEHFIRLWLRDGI